MCIKIERAQNGFEVELEDPEIVKANDESEGRYRDPYVCYVFKTKQEVFDFLDKVIDKLDADEENDESEYTSAFDEAAGESENE